MGTVDYGKAIATITETLETKQAKFFQQLEDKFATREKVLIKKHNDNFTALERKTTKIINKMQEECERKLIRKMRTDLDQHVEERRLENEESITISTRQMEANWTNRCNDIITNLEPRIQHAESRLNGMKQNFDKIDDIRSLYLADHKTHVRHAQRSDKIFNDLKKNNDTFTKEAQKHISALNSYCNTSRDRLADANKYHQQMAIHDDTYARQIAQQKNQLHTHGNWINTKENSIQKFIDDKALDYKNGLNDFTLNYAASEAAQILKKVEAHEADFSNRMSNCWEQLTTQITQEAHQVQHQGTHYLDKLANTSEEFDIAYEEKLQKWTSTHENFENNLKGTHQTFFDTHKLSVDSLIATAIKKSENKQATDMEKAIKDIQIPPESNPSFMTQDDKLSINADIIEIRLSIPTADNMQDYATKALFNFAEKGTLGEYIQKLPQVKSINKEPTGKVPPTDISEKDDSDFNSKHSKEKYKKSHKNHSKYSKSALPRDREFPSLFDRYETDTENSDQKRKARRRFRERPIKSGDNPPSDPSSSNDSDDSDRSYHHSGRGSGRREKYDRSRDRSPFHVDTYKLQKAFSHSCETMEELLQFYEDHISTLEEYGIDMIPLKEIREGKSLFKHYKSMTRTVQNKHSKLLHNIYIKEEVFPKSNVLSRSILKASTRDKDGENAMYQMLRGVVPALSKNPAPDSPPEYDECGDIYVFGSQLLNYFMLKELTGTRYTQYHKAEQFLKCLANTEHSTSASKLYTELHNIDPDKTRGKVERKFLMRSITTTVTNLTQKDPFQTDVHTNMLYCEPPLEEEDQYASVNAAFTKYNTYSGSSNNSSYGKGISKYSDRDARGRNSNPGRGFGGGRNHARGGRGGRSGRDFHQSNKEYSKPQYPNSHKSYVQCDACKMGNHICTECRFAPKVLSVIKWATQNKTKADKMVEKHAKLNSEPSRRVFVKKLITQYDMDPELEQTMLLDVDLDDAIEMEAQAYCAVTFE